MRYYSNQIFATNQLFLVMRFDVTDAVQRNRPFVVSVALLWLLHCNSIRFPVKQNFNTINQEFLTNPWGYRKWLPLERVLWVENK
jgi:hypothetical protein